MEATSYLWTDVPLDSPVPLLHRRLLKGEKTLVAQIHLEKGCKVALHSHESEQIAIMMSGKALWVIGEGPNQRELLMEGSGVLHLPSNVPHGVTVLEDSVIYDVLSPVGPMGVDQQKR